MDPVRARWVYTPPVLDRIDAVAERVGPVLPEDEVRTRALAGEFRDVEVLFSGWEGPVLDKPLLDAMPALRAVFYAAGTVRGVVTDAFWARGLPITTAAAANAVPTATFAEAVILLSLKQAWPFLRENCPTWAPFDETPESGVHGGVVGIVGLSKVGRLVARGLRDRGVRVLLADPTVSAEAASAEGYVKATLDEVFERADVVSLHAPWLPSTEGMVTGAHLRRMKRHATFVNTARGAIVREEDLVEVLTERPDLTACLDVTTEEPLPAESPLRTLPNVWLTPHIAGARHRECELLGLMAAEECRRFLAGEPLEAPVSEAQARHMA
jgi:phosphoglycerate dehydrogenase-like enzyme